MLDLLLNERRGEWAMKDCKDIHQIIRDDADWQDGWTRARSTGWALLFVVAVVVLVGVIS